MSALFKKDLVFKENKLPAKYRLTEEGLNLATTMLNGSKENTEPNNNYESGNLKIKILFQIIFKISKLSIF